MVMQLHPDLPDLTEILSTYLLPHLQLADLQSLLHTCRSLRTALDAASLHSRLKAARQGCA